MWILIWLITGTHPALPPTVVDYPTQAKCEIERKMIESQIKAVGATMESKLWCVSVTETEPAISWNLFTPSVTSH